MKVAFTAIRIDGEPFQRVTTTRQDGLNEDETLLWDVDYSSQLRTEADFERLVPVPPDWLRVDPEPGQRLVLGGQRGVFASQSRASIVVVSGTYPREGSQCGTACLFAVPERSARQSFACFAPITLLPYWAQIARADMTLHSGSTSTAVTAGARISCGAVWAEAPGGVEVEGLG